MIKILIVDDHAVLRAGLKYLLARCADIEVGGEAGSGNEALSLARSGRWDVMVLDMSMPGKSGIELIRQLKTENPHLPILVLSMHREDVYAIRALKAGASGYLCKDNAELQLEQAIRKVSSGGYFITTAVAEKMALGMLASGSPDAPKYSSLSDREYQVFQRIAEGAGLTEIAHQLNLSVKTISTHKKRIMDKLGLVNTAELVRYAVKHGLIADGVSTPD